MLNPEPADPLILAGQGISIIGHRMAEEGSVEIQGNSQLLAPVKPALVVLLLNLVAVNKCIPEFSIACMEVQSMLSTDQGEYLFQVMTQLVNGFCFSWIVARGLDSTSAKFGTWTFKSPYIISLPTVDRDGDAG